jgi:hypothetical protein
MRLANRRHSGIQAFAFDELWDLSGSSAPVRRPEYRPGTWLRTTLAGAASRPAIMTPHESVPSADGTVYHMGEIHPYVELRL